MKWSSQSLLSWKAVRAVLFIVATSRCNVSYISHRILILSNFFIPGFFQPKPLTPLSQSAGGLPSGSMRRFLITVYHWHLWQMQHFPCSCHFITCCNTIHNWSHSSSIIKIVQHWRFSSLLATAKETHSLLLAQPYFPSGWTQLIASEIYEVTPLGLSKTQMNTLCLVIRVSTNS